MQMETEMDDAAYTARMDALMLKVSLLFDKEDASANDAAMVSAVSCAWACYIGHETHKKRISMLGKMVEMMRVELQNMEDTEGRGRQWMH